MNQENLNSLIKAFHLALNQIDKEINLFIIGGKGWQFKFKRSYI